jgi:hypothetical protein
MSFSPAILGADSCPADRLYSQISFIETSGLRLGIYAADGVRVISLRQKPAGREMIDDKNRYPLFQLKGQSAIGEVIELTSLDAHKSELFQSKGKFIITYSDFGGRDITARVTITQLHDSDQIAFYLELTNNTDLEIREVNYPIMACKFPLDEKDKNDAIVFPRHEGVLLQQPHKYMAVRQARQRCVYPGEASMQFLGYYDSRGGLYMAAQDPEGHAKNILAFRIEDALGLTIGHIVRMSRVRQWSLPYPVVIDGFTGDWTEAADIYRVWARKQSWCAQKIKGRNIPEWLYKGMAFYNYNASKSEDIFGAWSFYPPGKAAELLNKLKEDLGVPIVATPFGWEKNASWIGPDYFPPQGGDDGYKKLTKSLQEQGSQMFVFLSGFRWGLERTETSVSGYEDFEKQGKAMAVRDRKGKIVYEVKPWAKNALLCAGCKEARHLLTACFRRTYELGINIAQLDQNVGGRVPVCYAKDHGHPPGPGLWQTQAMSDFLKTVYTEAKRMDTNRCLSLEEPCELFVGYLDLYHGRAFTYNNWPAYGAGAISIPLFAYVYHPYILGYAGWVGGGFDLNDDVELSIGRAFIYGMLLGVRARVWRQTLVEDGDTSSFEMWRRGVRLQQRCAKALLLGDMLAPPKLKGVRTRAVTNTKKGVRQDLMPVDNVQAATWLDEDDCLWYAIANTEDKINLVEIEILPPNKKGLFDVDRIGPYRRKRIARDIKSGSWLKLQLSPYELTCLRVELD